MEHEKEVYNDLKHSNVLFMEKVWPVIQNDCGGGHITPVEIMHDNFLAKDLDINCGIDIWQTIPGKGSRGIACRVQSRENATDWKTFTIRKSRNGSENTEYKKRKFAVDTGSVIYPYLTCQAYFEDDDTLIGCGVAKTADIINAINSKTKTKSFDNAVFYYVPYSDIGNVKMYPKPLSPQQQTTEEWINDYSVELDRINSAKYKMVRVV